MMFDESEKAWLDEQFDRLHQSMHDLHRKADILMSQQNQINTEVAEVKAFFDDFDTVLANLKAQAPASQLDLSGFDALAGRSAKAKAALDAQVAPAPAPAPAPATAQKPLYTHPAGGVVTDPAWPTADVVAEDGTKLYTFANDLPGGSATAASAAWVPYTGATKPAPTAPTAPAV